MVQRATSVIILLLKRRSYGQDPYDYWYTNTPSYGGPSNFKQLSSKLTTAFDTGATMMGMHLRNEVINLVSG